MLAEIILKSAAMKQKLYASPYRVLFSTRSAVEKSSHLDSMNTTKGRPYHELPGPTKYELFRGFMPGGSYHKMLFSDFISKTHEQYGDLYRIPGLMGKEDIVMAFNVEDIQKVFRTEGVWPDRPLMESLQYYRRKYRTDIYSKSDGLINSFGKEWAHFRTTVNPVLMQPRYTKNYVIPMQEVNSEFIQRIREVRDPETKEVPENFLEEINRLTLESVAVVALNKQLGLIRLNREKTDAKKLFVSLQTFFKLMFELDFQPSVWKYVWTPTFSRFKKALDIVYETTKRFVDESQRQLELEGKSNEDDGELGILEKLLKIDKSIAVVMALDMLFAGIDTTTCIMTGILLQIAKNTDKQVKLREEIRQFLPEKHSTFTVESMKNLPYLRACIKEGIRMHPIGPGIPRVIGENITLGGYEIPKGTRAMMNSNLLLRDEKFFPRPNEFIPERWIRGGPLENIITPFVYLPFGFGPRMCIGKRIVDLELEVTVARLVRNFKIEFNYPIENAFESHFINTPVIPLKFKFTDVAN